MDEKSSFVSGDASLERRRKKKNIMAEDELERGAEKGARENRSEKSLPWAKWWSERLTFMEMNTRKYTIGDRPSGAYSYTYIMYIYVYHDNT